ncbi:DEAD/DEAH box helicase [Candidatus Bealeia paramacronuclearis]
MLQQALDGLGFTLPTPIQAKAVPLALQGSDILGSAKTGTGKTLTFALPLLNHLLENVESSSVILSPTRELAQQIHNAIRALMGGRFGMKTALLIGGEPYGKQFSQLRMNPRIVVGTPGRVIDHLEKRTLVISDSDFLVLDETDRMFDMGLGEQVDEIISRMPTQRQTLMFSATFTPKVEALAQKYLKSPVRIFVDSGHTTAQNLREEIIELKDSDKDKTLLKALDQREGSVIIFVKTKSGADRLARYLTSENHSAAAIHGDLRQQRRERVMNAFRQGRHRIMVATDVAARGIDIPHIRHVINYDLPHSPEDYIHRVGRTARAGAEGFALNFISSGDQRRWYAIQRLMHPDQARSQRSERSERSRSSEESPRRGDRPWDRKRSTSRVSSEGQKSFKFGNRKPDSRAEFVKKPSNYEGKPRDYEAKPRSYEGKPRDFEPRAKSSFSKPQGESSFFANKKRDSGSQKDKSRRFDSSKSGAPFGKSKTGERFKSNAGPAKPFAAKKRSWDGKKSPSFKKAS